MKIRIVIFVVAGLIVVFGTSGRAQHDGHQMPGTAMDLCREQSQQVILVIDSANRRIELARQSNSAAEMRSAVDFLQAALVETRAKLTECVNSSGLEPSSPAPGAMAAMDHSKMSQSTVLDITFKSLPSPLKIGDNQLEVTVKGADGKPISGADVSVLFVMPAMPQMKMPEMRNEVKLKSAGDGKYAGGGQVMMAGSWNVTVSVRQNGKEIGQKKLTVPAK